MVTAGHRGGAGWHIFKGLAVGPDVLNFSNCLGCCRHLKCLKDWVKKPSLDLRDYNIYGQLDLRESFENNLGKNTKERC